MLHIVLNLVELRRHHHIGLIGGRSIFRSDMRLFTKPGAPNRSDGFIFNDYRIQFSFKYNFAFTLEGH